MVVKFCMKFR